jgi:hypothetical protein
VTAFIARDTFCGDRSSISPLPTAASDGGENVTGRSWQRGAAPAQTQLHRQHVAGERRLDSSARQPKGFTIEQPGRGERRLVSGAPPPARGIANCPGWNGRLRPRPAAAAQSHRSSSCFMLLRIYLHKIQHCVNSNLGSTHRSLFPSLNVLSGWSMTTGTRSGMPNASRCMRASSETWDRDLCTEPGRPAAVLRNRRLAFHFGPPTCT